LAVQLNLNGDVMKRLAVSVLILAVLACALAGCGSSQKAITQLDVKNLVDQAYSYIQQNGKEAALKEFMNKKGPFEKGALYIYAYDMNGKVLSHGGDPTLVGKDLSGYKDPNGVMAVQEAAKLAKTKGSGWKVVMFPNPTTKRQQDKLIYVKKVDDNWFIGSGVYL
jgi:cytochrome c